MNEQRIAITGLGVVTAGGIGIEELFANICAKKQSVKRIALFDPSQFPCQVAGQLEDFSASKFVPRNYRKAVKVMARDIEIAVAAADLAIRDAGITTRGIDEQKVDIEAARFGCNIGAGLICADLNELGSAVNTSVTDGKFDFKKWGVEGINNLTPLWLLKYLPNMLSCHVTIIHGLKGPSNTITCGEASGHLAIGEAARAIARNAADMAIAGGCESKVNPMNMLRQTLLKRLTTTGNDTPERACRPFDADADGTVIGEGGGLVVLEEQGRASARNARIYAEFAGFGAGCDPDGMNYLEPSRGDGLARAISAAISDAGISPEEIDLVVPQGTGVPDEDAAEADAIARTLGERAKTVAVSPLAGGFGNLFAGTGAVQLAVAAMALHRQTAPPAVNFEKAADRCGLNIQKTPADANLRYVLCCSHATGGQNAAIVLKKNG